jgi:hypothetical protein
MEPIGYSLFTRRQLETLRDRNFHRLPHLRVRGEKSALRFIQQVGFCFTFSTFGYDLPCLWVAVAGRRNPRWPKHTHHNPEILLTWNLKDTLPAKRLVYYGRLLKGKPTLISLDIFPAFVALIRGGRRSGDYLVDYREGRLSRTALRIMDALMEESPQDTPELRRRTGNEASERTREFERAMTELQRKLWVVKVEEIYEPFFSYRWDLLDHWLPDQIKAGETMSSREAMFTTVAQYVKTVLYSREGMIARLFDLPVAIVEAALEELEGKGAVVRGQRIRGLPGTWILSRSVIPTGAASRHCPPQRVL